MENGLFHKMFDPDISGVQGKADRSTGLSTCGLWQGIALTLPGYWKRTQIGIPSVLYIMAPVNNLT